MTNAYWNGFRVLEVRDYNDNGAYIAVDSTIHSRLMWVNQDSIELREVSK